MTKIIITKQIIYKFLHLHPFIDVYRIANIKPILTRVNRLQNKFFERAFANQQPENDDSPNPDLGETRKTPIGSESEAILVEDSDNITPELTRTFLTNWRRDDIRNKNDPQPQSEAKR